MKLFYPENKIRMLPEHIRAHPIFTGEANFGIMSGENPGHPAERQGHEALGEELKAMGLGAIPSTGRYGKDERNWFIHNPSLEQLYALGKKYGQDSVLHFEKGRPTLLYTNGPKEGLAQPPLPDFDFHPEKPPEKPPEDNYTTFRGGGHASLHFDWQKEHVKDLDQTKLSSIIKKSDLDLGTHAKSPNKTYSIAFPGGGHISLHFDWSKEDPKDLEQTRLSSIVRKSVSAFDIGQGLLKTLQKAVSGAAPAHNLEVGEEKLMKDHDLPEIRKAVADTIRARVDAYTTQLVELRQRELRKAERKGDVCITCGHLDSPESCSCLAKTEVKKNAMLGYPAGNSLPVGMGKAEKCAKCGSMHMPMKKCGENLPVKKEEKKSSPRASQARSVIDETAEGAVVPGETKLISVKDGGEGGEYLKVKKEEKKAGVKKADVPMAPAPTKSGSAAPPQSKAGSPKVGGGMNKAERDIKLPGLKKSKPIPGHLPAVSPGKGGGADLWNPLEGAPAAAPKPKYGMADLAAGKQALASQGISPQNLAGAPPISRPVDFTAAGAAAPAPMSGSAAVPLKAPSAPGKVMGSVAAPKPGPLDRFRAALKGVVQKSESPGADDQPKSTEKQS